MRFLVGILVWAAAACTPDDADLPRVTAAVETAAVASAGDAADDPAIWVNRDDPAKSLILGTDKQAGLYAYKLDGAVKAFLPAGRLNNVDIRQGVTVGGWTGDLAAASNRSDDTVTLLSVSADGIERLGAFPSALTEPYGLCMGIVGGQVAVFVAYKTGDLIMYGVDGPSSGHEVARLKLESQLEGCVFDDANQVLFVGEEGKGIWRFDRAGGDFVPPRLIDEVGGASGIRADVEGLAIFATSAEGGYLLASSQGNNSYAVYERGGDNRFVGRFSIADGPAIDGTEETDGIAASSTALGAGFPAGIFVVQDGRNAPRGEAQNFKFVDWREIEKALSLAD